MNGLRTRGLAWLLPILGTLAPTVAAQEASPTGPVEVWTIRATTANHEVSPELREIADQLRRSFKYTGYRLLEKKSVTVGPGGEFSTALSAGYRLSGSASAQGPRRVQLRLKLTRREGGRDVDKLATTITVERGRFQVIGGPRLEGEDVLVLAIAPR